MPKLAANLSWIYQEVPFLQRFGAAAAHGFKAVEILFPYEAPAKDIAAELKKHKLTQALFNLPPGDWSKGERGIAALPGREAEFAKALDTALEYAKVLECRTLHVMSGLIPAGGDARAMHRTFVSNLKMVCDRTAKSGLTIVMEPINHRDIPGYFTNTTSQVDAIIKEVGAPHLKLQLDLYHMQVTEGDLQKRTERLFPITRTSRSPAIQIATSRISARPTTCTCSMCSIASATTAMSASSTSPRRRPRPASAGRRSTASRRKQ